MKKDPGLPWALTCIEVVMKKTPLQLIKDEFGSKEALANKLLPLLDRPADEDQGEFERRIRTASNKKLLRLWAAETAVKDQFGTKEKLIEAIVKAKFNGTNPDYAARIVKYTKTRLLDMHRQVAS
ncbi:MAG: hypothetical protein ACJAYU_002181 [Bradymonadia bacterium]